MTQVAPEITVSPVAHEVEWPAPHRVLAAVDYSPQSGWAEKLAEGLAARFGADIRLVHVLDPETQAGELGELVREGEQFLADFPAGRLPEGKRLDRVFRMGHPVEEIISAAKDWSADVIAVGTHGRKGLDRFLMGSIAAGVLRRATCPVLCVGHEPPSPIHFQRILVAVDDSEQAGWAADCARRLAEAFGAQIALAHIAPFALPVEPGYGMVVDRADEALVHSGEEFLSKFYWPQGASSPARLVRQGPTAQEILGLAREWKADLIVLGTHSRRGLSRLLLGSTAEAVVRQSACPVLCVSHAPQSSSNQQ